MEITDFRIGTTEQVKINGKWYNLITFTDDCPYGKYGIKKKVQKPFNPYFFFNETETDKIENWKNKRNH